MKVILTLEYAIYLISLCDVRFEQPFFSQHALVWRVIGFLFLAQEFIGCGRRFKPDNNRILLPGIVKYMIYILAWMILAFFDTGTETDEYITLLGFILTIFLGGLQFARYNAVKEMLVTGFIVPNVMLILNDAANQINVFELLRQVNPASFFSTVYTERVRFSLGFPNPNTLGNLVTCLLCISFPLISMWKRNKGGKFFYIIIVALDVFDLVTLFDCGSRTGTACFLICLFLLVFLLSTDSKQNSAARKVIRPLSLIFIIAVVGIFFFDRIIYSYIRGRHGSFELLGLLSGFQYVTGRGVFSPGEVISTYSSHLDNYFVYLILTTGVVGLILYLLLFIKLFRDIRLWGSNALTYGIIGCFVADMLYGFGETCVFYPMFPSAAIFMILFISYSIAGVEEKYIDAIGDQEY
jgi:O-antigen ligase